MKYMPGIIIAFWITMFVNFAVDLGSIFVWKYLFELNETNEIIKFVTVLVKALCMLVLTQPLIKIIKW